MHALSLLALLLPLAAGNKHYQCDCMSWTAGDGQNWIHDATLSHYVCHHYYTNDVCVMRWKLRPRPTWCEQNRTYADQVLSFSVTHRAFGTPTEDL